MKSAEILGVFIWICVQHSLGRGGALDGCKLDFFSRCFKTDFQMISDPESVRKVCNPQTLLAAMTCMEKMKETCEAELRHTIETSGWSDAMALYCQNVDLMADNAHCAKAASGDIKKCVSTLFTSFRQKMIKRNITMMSDPRIIMQLTCEHKEETFECFNMKLARTCPEDVHDILTRVSKLLTKVTCTFGRYVDTTPTDSSLAEKDDQEKGEGYKHIATPWVIFLLVCIIHIL